MFYPPELEEYKILPEHLTEKEVYALLRETDFVRGLGFFILWFLFGFGIMWLYLEYDYLYPISIIFNAEQFLTDNDLYSFVFLALLLLPWLIGYHFSKLVIRYYLKNKLTTYQMEALQTKLDKLDERINTLPPEVQRKVDEIRSLKD